MPRTPGFVTKMARKIFRKATDLPIDVATTADGIERILLRGNQATSGQIVNWSTALQYADVISCIRVLVEGCALLPLNVLNGDGSEARSHYLYRLFKYGPSPFQTTMEWVAQQVGSLATGGNAYSYLNRSKTTGRVLEILPLHPASVTVRIREDWSRVYTVAPTRPQGAVMVLDQDQVLHTQLWSLDGVVGYGPITLARETIGLGMAAEKRASSFFANGSTPTGVIESDHILKDDEYTALKESWDASHAGMDNAHRVAILEGGIKFVPTMISQADAEFLDSRKFTRSQIAGIFRVPPHKIADMEGATFSNIEHQSLEYVQDALSPYLEALEQRLEKQVLSEADRTAALEVAFDTSRHLRGDKVSQAKFYSIMRNWGLLNADECRRMDNLPPLPNGAGATYLQPLNMLDPARDAGDEPSQPPSPGEPDKQTEAAAVDAASTVQDTALNGAQVASLLAIVDSVATGKLPATTARAMISAAFPGVSPATIDSMLAGLEGFEPKAPTAPEPPAAAPGKDVP